MAQKTYLSLRLGWFVYLNNKTASNNQEFTFRLLACPPCNGVYALEIDLDNPKDEYALLPVGHGNYSGFDGNNYTDLSTITTALQIIDEVKVESEYDCVDYLKFALLVFKIFCGFLWLIVFNYVSIFRFGSIKCKVKKASINQKNLLS